MIRCSSCRAHAPFDVVVARPLWRWAHYAVAYLVFKQNTVTYCYWEFASLKINMLAICSRWGRKRAGGMGMEIVFGWDWVADDASSSWLLALPLPLLLLLRHFRLPKWCQMTRFACFNPWKYLRRQRWRRQRWWCRLPACQPASQPKNPPRLLYQSHAVPQASAVWCCFDGCCSCCCFGWWWWWLPLLGSLCENL